MPLVDDPGLHTDRLAMLNTLKERNLGLVNNFWAVNYGNYASCEDQNMKNARTDFRGSYLIPTFRNVRISPRPKARGALTDGAKDSLNAFALSLVGRLLRDEMKSFEKGYGNIKTKELS